MSNLMYAQMGLNAVSAFTSYSVSKTQQKMEQATQVFSNTMQSLSAAQAKNTVTQNEIQVQDASTRQSLAISRQALIDQGAARVAAGAAGVEGGSVDATMQSLRRSAAVANKARLDQLALNTLASNQERTNIELNRIYGKDTSVIPKPSAFSALLGLGAQTIDTYDAYQTEGDQIASRLNS